MSEIDQIKTDWDDLADMNAAWFNVPSDRIADKKWEIEKFFQTGKEQIKRDMQFAYNSGITISKGVALDFGCGIGRVTQALAEEFENCYGVDISPKMIEKAMEFNRFEDRCQYIANPAANLQIFANEFFDFIYSNNALQHNPPDVIKNYLLEFIRTVKTGGVLLFQIPVQYVEEDRTKASLRKLPRYHPKRIWNKLKGILIGHDIETRYYRLSKLGFSKKWLFEKLGLRPRINMNWLAETEIRALLGGHGCSIKHVEKYRHQNMTHAIFAAIKSA